MVSIETFNLVFFISLAFVATGDRIPNEYPVASNNYGAVGRGFTPAGQYVILPVANAAYTNSGGVAYAVVGGYNYGASVPNYRISASNPIPVYVAPDLQYAPAFASTNSQYALAASSQFIRNGLQFAASNTNAQYATPGLQYFAPGSQYSLPNSAYNPGGFVAPLIPASNYALSPISSATNNYHPLPSQPIYSGPGLNENIYRVPNTVNAGSQPLPVYPTGQYQGYSGVIGASNTNPIQVPAGTSSTSFTNTNPVVSTTTTASATSTLHHGSSATNIDTALHEDVPTPPFVTYSSPEETEKNSKTVPDSIADASNSDPLVTSSSENFAKSAEPEPAHTYSDEEGYRYKNPHHK
ncbi:uncharacterized protein LOC131803191 [Musca domestica]|uniref:Uncharacterized protein LOC131803191 n=1 Tax=Musca domestica TaxID=7370 RepID=A0ABM3V398_MUSDO|nr:uncharacterized protein LOC131803191 [Musca domestica]